MIPQELVENALRYLDLKPKEAQEILPKEWKNVVITLTPSQITNFYSFRYLITLNVSCQKLTLLPELPSSLQILYCDYNQLTSLPELPSGLQELHCYNNNQLTSLPEFPSGL